jgi:hypothetical protein
MMTTIPTFQWGKVEDPLETPTTLQLSDGEQREEGESASYIELSFF